jgi:hypothetical protein
MAGEMAVLLAVVRVALSAGQMAGEKAAPSAYLLVVKKVAKLVE